MGEGERRLIEESFRTSYMAAAGDGAGRVRRDLAPISDVITITARLPADQFGNEAASRQIRLHRARDVDDVWHKIASWLREEYGAKEERFQLLYR